MAKKTAKKAAKKTAKKTTKKAAAKKPAAKQVEPLIVASKVKAFIKGKDKMTASETLEAINAKIYCMLEDAVCRAEANGRKTVKPQDL
jgi:histone H3/H4